MLAFELQSSNNVEMYIQLEQELCVSSKNWAYIVVASQPLIFLEFTESFPK